MPTTYTHDLFGKIVYKSLPDEQKQILRRNKDLYRIGQHGPDVLFYFMISKNPVSQFGVQMHHRDAASFFEKGKGTIHSMGFPENPLFARSETCDLTICSSR